MSFIISQIFGAVAACIIVSSFQFKDVRKLLIMQTLSSVLFALQFLFLEAYAGLACNVLGMFLRIAVYFRDKNGTLPGERKGASPLASVWFWAFCAAFAVVGAVTSASRKGIDLALVVVNTEMTAGNFVVDITGLNAVSGVYAAAPYALEGAAREIVFDGVGDILVAGVTAAGTAEKVKLVKATAGNMVFDFSGDGAVVAAQIYFLQIGSALNVVAECSFDGSSVIAAVEVMGVVTALDGVCNIADGGS